MSNADDYVCQENPLKMAEQLVDDFAKQTVGLPMIQIMDHAALQLSSTQARKRLLSVQKKVDSQVGITESEY